MLSFVTGKMIDSLKLIIKLFHQGCTLKPTPTTCSPKSLLVPANECFICNRTIEQAKGEMLTGAKVRGVRVFDRKISGGNDFSFYRQLPLDEAPERYVTIWGERETWTDEHLKRAYNVFKQGLHPWFCQQCGGRTCHLCGAPKNYPMPCTIIHDKGNQTELGIKPFDPGCSNTDCEKYRDFYNEALASD